MNISVNNPTLFLLGVAVGYFIALLKRVATPPPDSEAKVRRDIGAKLQEKATSA